MASPNFSTLAGPIPSISSNCFGFSRPRLCQCRQRPVVQHQIRRNPQPLSLRCTPFFEPRRQCLRLQPRVAPASLPAVFADFSVAQSSAFLRPPRRRSPLANSSTIPSLISKLHWRRRPQLSIPLPSAAPCETAAPRHPSHTPPLQSRSAPPAPSHPATLELVPAHPAQPSSRLRCSVPAAL